MATKLKIVEDVADIVPAPQVPDFEIAPTRKRHAGWTADKQRRFIEHLSLTGNVGEACALVGVASSSAYRLRNKAGADSFARAWDAALVLAATRGTAIAWDRALNGRVERHYKNGELVMERRIPSDYLLTWLLSRLDPLTFGSPAAKAHALATGDPREKARKELPGLMAAFEDVSEEECPTEDIDYLDDRLGETGSGEPISDAERGGTRARTCRPVAIAAFRPAPPFRESTYIRGGATVRKGHCHGKPQKLFVTGTGSDEPLLSVLLREPQRSIAMPDLAAARARLQGALTELEARLGHIARDLDQPPDRDWDEQAIEVEDDQALEHQGELVTREIASVQRALARIEDGTYGICVRCGEEIAHERLDARPEAALCIDCARRTSGS